jgi:hypothetical protein
MPSAAEIVRRSAAVNAADWKAQAKFSHREQDTKSKVDSNGRATVDDVKTYEVMMIEGSPYKHLIAINGKPLSAAQARQEQDKLKREIARRQHESASERQQRLSKYQRDREEEKLLMEQMVIAFRFTLVGRQQMDGVDCYVLDASPDPNYRPPVQRARVLTGMKGRLYIDKAGYHWVRMEAEVTSPVEFGLFLARVKPGTKFELDQAPVGKVWLPKHFVQSVNTTILGIYGIRNKEEEIYTDYHPVVLTARLGHPASAGTQ